MCRKAGNIGSYTNFNGSGSYRNRAQATPFPENATIYLAEGERDGPLLVQKIYPDHIEGQNFIEYPLAAEKGTPITLYVGQSAGTTAAIYFSRL